MALYLSCERVVVEEHGVIRSKGERGGQRPYIPCFGSVECFRHIVDSFPVSSQEE